MPSPTYGKERFAMVSICHACAVSTVVFRSWERRETFSCAIVSLILSICDCKEVYTVANSASEMLLRVAGRAIGVTSHAIEIPLIASSAPVNSCSREL